MGRNISVLIGGIVTMGIISALVLPGRTTAGAIKAAGTATQGVLGTAITGKS